MTLYADLFDDLKICLKNALNGSYPGFMARYMELKPEVTTHF